MDYRHAARIYIMHLKKKRRETGDGEETVKLHERWKTTVAIAMEGEWPLTSVLHVARTLS